MRTLLSKTLFVIAGLLLSINASAYDFESNGIYYSITENSTCKVEAGENLYSGAMIIPETVINNAVTYTVTGIGTGAFLNCTELTSLDIPKTITYMEDGAFYNSNCTALDKVNISDVKAWNDVNMVDTPNSPLYYAKKLYLNNELISDLVIPDGVTSIGYNFCNCTNITSVTLPNSVTKISSFTMCTGLTSINIPEGIHCIEMGTFSGCSSLKSISLPNSVKYIGTKAFDNCSSLEKAELPNSLVFLGSSAFSFCSSLNSITLPNSLVQIGYSAFNGCTSLKAIEIPDGITHLRNSTFNNCFSLESITLPNSVISVGNKVFNGTAWYNNQPDGLVYIGNIAYGYKGTMPENSTINIKEGTVGIANQAFNNFTNLVGITVPNSLQTIGYKAFYKTTWYNNQPDGLMYIGNVAYKYKGTMPDNTSIDIKEGTISISSDAFSGCDKMTAITLPNTLKHIGSWSFEACDGLTSINIPNSVTTIDIDAFTWCQNLTSIVIPNSVTTTIGEQTYSPCFSMTSITIGSSVPFIEWLSLPLDVLTEINFMSPTPPIWDAWLYASGTILENITLNVPKGSLAAYRADVTWGKFVNIVEFDPSGVEEVKGETGVNIVANGTEITVKGADDGAKVEVYDISGNLVYSGMNKTIAMPTHGVYIVKVAGVAMKVGLTRKT